MKYIVLGTTAFTKHLAQAIIDSKETVSLLITLNDNLLPDNSTNFEPFCNKYNIKLYKTSDINKESTCELIKAENPDFIISSWPKILGKNILEIPKYFTVGTHPTFHLKKQTPLHWTIALGIKNTALSFFIMDEGIDSGEILLQKLFVNNNKPIRFLLEKLNDTAYAGMFELCQLLRTNPLIKGFIQNKYNENIWRKRNLHDLILDPRFEKSTFVNIVNSFSSPYDGAILVTAINEIHRIVSVKEQKKSERQINWENREYGYIFDIKDHEIFLKIAETVLILKCKKTLKSSQLKRGNKIYPPSYYLDKTNYLSNLL